MARARDSTTLLETLTHAHLTALATRVSQRALHFKTRLRSTAPPLTKSLRRWNSSANTWSVALLPNVALAWVTIRCILDAMAIFERVSYGATWIGQMESFQPTLGHRTLCRARKTILFLYMTTTTVWCCVNPRYGVNWGFVILHNSTAPCTLYSCGIR